MGVLVYAAYIGAGGWGGRPGGEDLEALAEAYSGGEGGTGDRWEHYVGGGEGDVGCFLIDGLRRRAVEEVRKEGEGGKRFFWLLDDLRSSAPLLTGS